MARDRRMGQWSTLVLAPMTARRLAALLILGWAAFSIIVWVLFV